MRASTKTILRFVLIGAFHATVFIWLIPFVIIPKYDGVTSARLTTLVVVPTVVVTALIFFYPVFKRRRSMRNNSE